MFSYHFLLCKTCLQLKNWCYLECGDVESNTMVTAIGYSFTVTISTINILPISLAFLIMLQ